MGGFYNREPATETTYEDQGRVFNWNHANLMKGRKVGCTHVRALRGFSTKALPDELKTFSLPCCWKEKPWRTERAPMQEFDHAGHGMPSVKGSPAPYDWLWEETSQRWTVMSQSDPNGFASCAMRTSLVSGKRSISHRRSNRKRILDYSTLRVFTGGPEV
jgi:hypothetical protein